MRSDRTGISTIEYVRPSVAFATNTFERRFVATDLIPSLSRIREEIFSRTYVESVIRICCT